tara:strand:+ start:561 stop:671 length:111 start_codon:yes stop_codon:yes gene_type:complete
VIANVVWKDEGARTQGGAQTLMKLNWCFRFDQILTL